MLNRYYSWSSMFCFGVAIAIGVASFFVDVSWSIVFNQYLLLLCGYWFFQQAKRFYR